MRDINPAVRGHLDELRRRFRGFPDDENLLSGRPLRDLVPHARLQMIGVALEQMIDGFDVRSLDSSATGADLLYWLENADATQTNGSAGRHVYPRGIYRTKDVRLRPIAESDVESLYQASVDPEIGHRWRFRGATPAPSTFRDALFSHDVVAQFIVAPTEGADFPIGLVVAYGRDSHALHCHLAFQRAAQPAAHSERKYPGALIEGFLLMVQYTFDHFDFDKVYVEVPQYNVSLFEGVSLLVGEAKLSEYFYYGDQWWDQYIFAIYRGRWDEFAANFRGSWPDHMQDESRTHSTRS